MNGDNDSLRSEAPARLFSLVLIHDPRLILFYFDAKKKKGGGREGEGIERACCRRALDAHKRKGGFAH